MANKSLFQSTIGNFIPKTNTFNEAGGNAYSFTPKHALAQYAITGCFNSTYYASAGEQLEKVLSLCKEIEPEFIARTAVYCRERGFMKDMPALLCAILSVKNRDLLAQVFSRVIDNGKMLRNFVQIIRSGVVGRKSLGSLPKRLVREWFENRTDENIFRASVGQSPSFADIIKMVHPKPKDETREAFFGYMIGRQYNEAKLPELVKQYEAFKADNKNNSMPNVPFEMLTMLDLTEEHWKEIAKNAPWQMTRMNLNTFARHKVFTDPNLVKIVANRLRNKDLISKAKAFPYQLMAAYLSVNSELPGGITEALQDAMEIATSNVPKFEGKVYVCPDVSGSMSSPVTGYRAGATSKVRCIDVAALVAATVLRNNPNAEVLPFECSVVNLKLNPRDSVMTNAQKLAYIGGGGTNCSAPLALLNRRKAKGDLVIFVSDNESWMDAKAGRGTATMQEWQAFRKNNPNARLVCIDIQPYSTTQASDRADILNVGGFSDQVFDVIDTFNSGDSQGEHWVNMIEAVKI